ncbi:MAG TPA: YdbH domain-containing protein [Opitutaceae bacterium]
MRWLSLFVLGSLLAAAGLAAGWSLPPLAGDLRGEFTPVPGRTLQWQVSLKGSAEPLRPGELIVTGEGAELRVAFDLDSAAGVVRWQITEGRIDLATWLPVLAAYLGRTDLLDLEVKGTLVLAGEGEAGDQGVSGRMVADLKDVSAWHGVWGVQLDGIEGRIGGPIDGLLAGDVPFDLSVQTITTLRLGARLLAVRGKLVGFSSADIATARVEIAGGAVEADLFSATFEPLAVAARIRVTRVGLQDIVQLVPAALAQANGRVNGDVRVAWSETDGFQIGEGRLRLDASEPTTLTLAASPGFLTSQVPSRFVLLPAWLGPLSRWFSPINPAHQTLREIELGQIPLQVQSLSIDLSPDGDAAGRTASVSIRGRPVGDGGVVEVVTFQINVAGPLSEVLKLGVEQDFSVDLR